MLVLTRKKGQSIDIGENISIVIVDVTGDTVRLGIEAPPEVSIYRSEIYRAIQEENRAAVAPRDVVARLISEAPEEAPPEIEDRARPTVEDKNSADATKSKLLFTCKIKSK